MPSIELAKPRILANKERGKTYLLTVAPIAKKQWLRYFEGIVSTSENQAGKRIDSFDSSSARIALLEANLTDASGYKTADGSPVNAKPGWQQLIPLRHRQAAANALVDVERADPDEDAQLMLGADAVYLNAVWSADEKGMVQKFNGLCHRFKTPTDEQQRRYSRDSSRSVIVGGSRKAKTRWLGPQATLVELYDELIVSVEGYAMNGGDLGGDRDAIVSWMDAYHKVAAADILFSPAAANVVDEAND